MAERVHKFIIHVTNLEHLVLAARAAKWMQAQAPGKKDGILEYGDALKTSFYVRRNKASITVRPCY